MIGRRLSRSGRPGLIGTAARTAVIAGTATSVSSRVAARHQQAAAQAAPAPPPPAPAPAPAPAPQAAPNSGSNDQTLAQLERLVELRQSGMLTDDEFTAAKQRLLTP
ncbi:SHOCT domain-containing protein [Kitasatospora sp. NPDC057940]|uniref:SHOCT domain-containing protein n=1 Tax=Kitasatospora sp. NPDC057940 TaxID=3346285 RepID=UPI0036DDF170